MVEFHGFGKIPRWSRDVVITEKIDGTNAQIYIPELTTQALAFPLLVGSRTRWITPDDDNHGFARWAYEHVEELLRLGPGHHFGEFWGQGIQRGYGLDHKRFSLFNTAKWSDDTVRPACCHVVPVVLAGPLTDAAISLAMESLWHHGSVAAP